MILSKSNYAWSALCSLLLSCSGMNELVLPQGLDNNFRSGEIKHPFIANSLQVLDYKVINDSGIKSTYNDTTLTFGIILPRSSFVFKTAENKMVFGTDSLQCTIWYSKKILQKESGQNSLLTDILLKPDINDPNFDRDKINITPYKKVVTGVIQSSQLKEEVQFQFEHTKAEKIFDSAGIKGYIKSGKDSFFIKPLYKVKALRGKNVKPMQILQGYSLMKEDSLYAFLQHAPLIKRKDVLYLNTKTSPADQMVVAAYFSLVSRLVLANVEGTLY